MFAFSNRALQSICGERPIALAIVWVVFGGSSEALLANDLFRHNPFPAVDVIFGGERCLIGDLCAPLFSD